MSLTNPLMEARTAARTLVLMAALTLSACQSADPNAPPAPFPDAPSLDQLVTAPAITQIERRDFLDAGGVGFAYVSGLNGNDELFTQAAASNIDTIAPPTLTGTAQYTGTSNAVSLRRDNNFVSTVLLANILPLSVPNTQFDRTEHSATVVIDANLSTGTFGGRNTAVLTGGTFSHDFTGEIRDGRLQGTGSVSFGQAQALESELLGRIGDNRAVLVFEAGNSTDRISGGIDVSR